MAGKRHKSGYSGCEQVSVFGLASGMLYTVEEGPLRSGICFIFLCCLAFIVDLDHILQAEICCWEVISNMQFCENKACLWQIVVSSEDFVLRRRVHAFLCISLNIHIIPKIFELNLVLR